MQQLYGAAGGAPGGPALVPVVSLEVLLAISLVETRKAVVLLSFYKLERPVSYRAVDI
jgi:hypothetical protein